MTIVKEFMRCTSEVFFARVTTTTILEDSVPYRRLNIFEVGLGSAIFLLHCGLQMIILHISIILLTLNLITIRIVVRVLIQLTIAVGVCGQIGSLLYRRP